MASTEMGSLIYHGTVDPGFTINVGAFITPPKNAESYYKISVLARNKTTYELLTVRFNEQEQRWEYKWHIERIEKPFHYNPKTKMAEGGVQRILENTDWQSNVKAVTNPAKITKIH